MDIPDEEEFRIEDLSIEIHCPHCGNEMVRDGNSLTLAESPRGVMFECGKCEEITQWELSYEPLAAKQVPVIWGGTL